MKYRADVDGLRAIAIVPVVLFHADLALFSGGYVGVDVFFVISGYLISSILASDINENKFSLVDFYKRRIVRIFPALYTVIAFCCAIVYFYFLPADFYTFFKNLIAVVLFYSNIAFRQAAGYFNTSMQTNPLLHTWSLAVEEQFYIFFPPLLFLLSKYLRRYTAPILAAILLLSFAYAVQKVGTKPVSAFYMTPARAWELLVGALIAIQPLARVKFAIVREGLAATGLILIAAAVVGFTSATPFPGAWAAVPVGGAALIIAFAPDTLTGRLLSTSPLVFIGKISYSLYLWHWPLFVFSKYLLPDPPSPLIKAGLCALSFGLGYLSWRFVEQPIRQWRSLGPATILAAGGATMAATLAIGLAGVAMNGAPGRFEPEVLRLAKYADDHSPQREACHSDGSRFIAPAASCVYGPRDRAEYALWGDSIGVELAYALGQIAEQKGKGLMYMTTSSCPPSLDLVTENRGCAKQNAAILQYLVASKTIKKVVLVGNYAGYPDRSGTLVGMKRTVEALSRSGKDVVIVLPLPSAPWDVPERLARAQIRGEPPEQVRLSRRDYDKGAGDIVRAFDALRGAKVVTVDPTSVLCGAKDCAVYEPPHALFSDEKHLTVEGARRVAPIVAPYIN